MLHMAHYKFLYCIVSDFTAVYNSKFHSVFERKPTQLPPLAVRVSGDLQAVGFEKE